MTAVTAFGRIASPPGQGTGALSATPIATAPRADVQWRRGAAGAVVGSIGAADRACRVFLPVRRRAAPAAVRALGTPLIARRARARRPRGRGEGGPWITASTAGARRGRPRERGSRVPVKFVLVSASLVAVAGGVDFFKFCRGMRDGGAEKRWRDLVDGAKSGKDGHAGEPTVIYDVRGRRGRHAELARRSSSRTSRPPCGKPSSPPRTTASSSTPASTRVRRAPSPASGSAAAGHHHAAAVKNLVLSSDRTVSRKIAEILLSLKVERNLTKDELLEAYLNHVYWGHGVYGVAGAAASYFGKTPNELDVGEAALLAAVLPAPEAPPYANPAVARHRAEHRAGSAWRSTGTWTTRRRDGSLIAVTGEPRAAPAQRPRAEHRFGVLQRGARVRVHGRQGRSEARKSFRRAVPRAVLRLGGAVPPEGALPRTGRAGGGRAEGAHQSRT